jgi:hypothetical protein
MSLRQKQDIPWLTPEIKRLIRKRERIYKKLKSTRVEERPNIVKKHRPAKHLVQQKLRQSYWNYIENIIIEDSKLAERKPNKKLWSFIKKQKKGKHRCLAIEGKRNNKNKPYRPS